MNICTQEQFKKFIETENNPESKLAFEILFWTGMRSVEILAITPTDILPNKSILKTKNFTRLDSKDIISELKTPKVIEI